MSRYILYAIDAAGAIVHEWPAGAYPKEARRAFADLARDWRAGRHPDTAELCLCRLDWRGDELMASTEPWDGHPRRAWLAPRLRPRAIPAGDPF